MSLQRNSRFYPQNNTGRAIFAFLSKFSEISTRRLLVNFWTFFAREIFSSKCSKQPHGCYLMSLFFHQNLSNFAISKNFPLQPAWGGRGRAFFSFRNFLNFCFSWRSKTKNEIGQKSVCISISMKYQTNFPGGGGTPLGHPRGEVRKKCVYRGEVGIWTPKMGQKWLKSRFYSAKNVI